MKKGLKIFLIVFCCLLVIGGAFGGFILYHRGVHPSKWHVESDTSVEDVAFEDVLQQLDMMENTWQTALPQTAIYDIVKAHFAAPLPEGKTTKKAIVIGYDGCRVDTFRLLKTSKRSAINLLLNDGGHAVFCYAGGSNYPHALRQATSTAPGWCSMLTGVLSDEHHITDNNQAKEVEPKTLALSLPEDGTVQKSAFYTTWTGFFVEPDSTYVNERKYIRENGIHAKYLCGLVDPLTRLLTLADLKSKHCSDFIFSILDYPDHAGHAYGFTLQEPLYADGFRSADGSAAAFVEAIRNRKTYDSEDWLILISTDHGGLDGGHGGPSIDERITFIVSNKEIPT